MYAFIFVVAFTPIDKYTCTLTHTLTHTEAFIVGPGKKRRGARGAPVQNVKYALEFYAY